MPISLIFFHFLLSSAMQNRSQLDTEGLEALRPTSLPLMETTFGPNVNRIKLQKYTTAVTDFPYDPVKWKNRAICFISLGFPELAAGDAYKSLLLFKLVLTESETSSIGSLGWIQYGMSRWMGDPNLILWTTPAELCRKLLQIDLRKSPYETHDILLSALCYIGAVHDAKKLCAEPLRLYPSDVSFSNWVHRLNTRYDAIEATAGSQVLQPGLAFEASLRKNQACGAVRMVLYPWIPKKFLVRPPELILQVNKDLEEVSNGLLEVKKSTIGNNLLNAHTTNLGIFVRKDVKRNEVVLQSPGPLGVTARNTYAHIRLLTQTTSDYCYNCGVLLKKYGYAKGQLLSFEAQVLAPIKVVQTLGVDVIANLDYDFWVLNIIWHRMRDNWAFHYSNSNRDSIDTVSCMSPYNFLNHSCDPMLHVDSATMGRNTFKTWYASRDIKAGEEVFITYVSYKMPKRDRQIALEPYLAGKCTCSRCQSEV
ncbi:uncharacterized protein LY89DRAFT_786692 [Mollisia scopiformis]|uniref:SET domain-containing protein n=1 Tax=Mollisia scopiformis TaxID=149040 RepID=A0A194WSV8_MOLSC|nr:uncharacterized protein LY89DRAFT_786692 [Mollisia scopiformis]KUJ11036.1 hypothetical protein LY89DRAFT_786692 [Mollisia scopiformis]